jgi:hypothetical protein
MTEARNNFILRAPSEELVFHKTSTQRYCVYWLSRKRFVEMGNSDWAHSRAPQSGFAGAVYKLMITTLADVYLCLEGINTQMA